MNAIIITPVKTSAVSSATVIDSLPGNNAQNTCYSCVDDHRIPPCAGFSQDYSCLPSLGNNQPN
ncbi:MAG: hypothetical protein ACQJCO_02190 [cyanobacterium endosymbiont of Rhopalodia sterrenbergii]